MNKKEKYLEKKEELEGSNSKQWLDNNQRGRDL
jgi:hypothetical protein